MLESIEAGFRAWLAPGGAAIVAVLGTLVLYHLFLLVLRQLSASRTVVRIFVDAASGALGFCLCLLALNFVLEFSPPELPLLAALQRVTTLLLIVAMTWAAVRLASAIGDVIVELNPVEEGAWRHARKVETQTRFLIRGLNILVVILGLGTALMTFDSVQQLGASLLASAGIGGIILGFAARPVLGNLLAGMQIALTEPFRIDDVLFVEGEWCWVEEVTATYVVLRVWDLRRMVVPLQWFIENPFENWTRHTTQLVGSAMVWLDYAIPMQPLREEFERLLHNSELWDGDTATVQIVDASERAQQVRFLVSAANSTDLWHLRCEVREGMVTFAQEHYPQYLPRLRAMLADGATREDLESTPEPTTG